MFWTLQMAAIPMESSAGQEKRAALEARWALCDAGLAAEVQARGCLPEGELSEDEIAKIAVEMTS